MILHLDLDCFFAAAHRINNPQLHNIPIAVGGRSNLSIFGREKEIRHLSAIEGAFTSSILSSNGNKTFKEYFVDPDGRIRGIITTSSYEARAFGVKTAMSVAEALRFCPNLIVLPPNYPLYHKLSHKLKILLEKEIPSIEQFSIDEFFGDVTGWIKDEDIVEFASKLKQQILNELGLPISIGIAKTKWIAKLGTNAAKPNGVRLIKPDEVDDFIKDIPINAFPGIGKGYQERLSQRGIKTLGDIKNRKNLFCSWGKPGIQLYHRICGTDNEEISLAQSKKSIGLGRSFDPENNRDEIRRRITILSRHLSFLAHQGKHNPMTFFLKIKYQYGSKAKDSINTNRLFSEQHLKQAMVKMFDAIDIHPTHAVVQVNITLSNFEENKILTMDLLNYEDDIKQSKLTTSMQKLRDKFGIDIIKSAGEL
ncbi:DNA polymerase IV [Sulfurovum sp.]|uniref:DNA polymerase Y family protein n=1 Tax=Sulfurovum sp. TaxID=1969726 RepID=UPI002867F265|nr:DNA polymerase IV [Sulfurovum sp.]